MPAEQGEYCLRDEPVIRRGEVSAVSKHACDRTIGPPSFVEDRVLGRLGRLDDGAGKDFDPRDVEGPGEGRSVGPRLEPGRGVAPRGCPRWSWLTMIGTTRSL